MGLTVTTPAKTEQLTTLGRVRDEIPVTTDDDELLLEVFIRQASDIIKRYCNRTFARQVYTETAKGYGGPYLTLREAPVVALGTVTRDGAVQTDVSIEDASAGILYRQDGFDWTAQRYAGILAAGWMLDQGMPTPLSEEPLWSVGYTAGFVLPSQNVVGLSGISVDATDDSFNDASSRFPSLLKSGDIIETAGFTNAVNNGRFVVTGTPTTAKIAVTAALTTESAGVRTVLVQNLPGDVERGCIETVKSLFAARSNDSRLVEKHAGPIGMRYSENGASYEALPPAAIGLLRSWVRSHP